jgi:hypothetical protein
MSDSTLTNPVVDPLDSIVRPFAPLPDWVARRLLRPDERVTWVRGPRLSPSWERYATHPGLFLIALALAAACLEVGWLVGWTWFGGTPVPVLAAIAIVLGCIFVLGFSAGYFTRLVVTDRRLFIVQGYELCRSYRIEDLPASLVHYRRWEGQEARRYVDLDALQTMLGSKSEQFTESKTILAFGKHRDRIQEGRGPHHGV